MKLNKNDVKSIKLLKVSNSGYKVDSPDRNETSLIIPSGQITMKNVGFPILGTDNMGNQQIMLPGYEYQFPGDYVHEVPLAQNGTQVDVGKWLQQQIRQNQQPLPSDNTIVGVPQQMKHKQLTDLQMQQQVATANRVSADAKETGRQIRTNRTKDSSFNGRDQFHIADKMYIGNPDNASTQWLNQYLSPVYQLGQIADNLGNKMNRSIVSGNPIDAIKGVGETAAAGLLGFDPLGQVENVIKNPFKLSRSSLQNEKMAIPKGTFLSSDNNIPD